MSISGFVVFGGCGSEAAFEGGRREEDRLGSGRRIGLIMVVFVFHQVDMCAEPILGILLQPAATLRHSHLGI